MGKVLNRITAVTTRATTTTSTLYITTMVKIVLTRGLSCLISFTTSHKIFVLYYTLGNMEAPVLAIKMILQREHAIMWPLGSNVWLIWLIITTIHRSLMPV